MSAAPYNISAGDAHTDANVSLFECRSIINTVTSHRSDMAFVL